MPDRGTTSPKRSLEAAGALVVILVLGLAFRLIIAYVLLPGSGFGVDRGTFQAWASELAANGSLGFYDRGFFIDYTPGYLYVLWIVGLVGQASGGIGDLIKLPPILADVAIAWLVHSMVRELGGSRRAALLGAAIVLVNPVAWFDSGIWGQVDSFGVVFLLLALRELWRGRPERASILAAVAAVIKPQLGILVPILVVVLIRRHLVLPLIARRRRVSTPAPVGIRPAVEDRLGPGPLRLLTSGLAGLLAVWLLCLPFGIGIVGLVEQVVKTAGGYPYLTVNGYNPWALFSDGGNGLAVAGTWLRDSVGDKPGEVATLVWGIPAVLVGTGLLLAVIAAVCVVVARRDDRWTILLAVTVLAIAFFVVPTRVHERYLFPFFALGAILAAVSGRWAVAYLVLALASFGNLYAILLTPFYKNPGVTDWLGLGPAIRSPWGVTLIAVAHLAVFVFALTELRRSRASALAAAALAGAAAEAPGDAREGAAVDARMGRPAPVAGAATGTAASAGLVGDPGASASVIVTTDHPLVAPTEMSTWQARARDADRAGRDAPGGLPLPFGLGRVRSILPDRSRRLHWETGGRFDRLDLWFLVVIVVAALVIRGFRLAEPYRMHFDEVYHARTATEFLQDWRYGKVHDIYEFTHPHLAKYAMALGLIAFGDDRVTAQTDLGTSVADVLVEPRWEDPTMPGGRAGDRFYVAGGDELRAYDLGSRELVARWSIPGATSLALDPVAHRVLIGTESGAVHAIDTASELDVLRADSTPSPGTAAGPPEPLAQIGAPITHLAVTDDGTGLAAATSDGEVVSIDPGTGTIIGRAKVEGLAGLADGGTGDGLTADLGTVTDARAAAETLAGLVGGDAAVYRARLVPREGDTTTPAVVLGTIPDAARAALDAAIADGRLAGFSVTPLPRIAAAGGNGVKFIAPSTGEVVDTVDIGAPAGGLAKVTGIDKPSLYVTLGDERMAVLRLPDTGSKDRPRLDTTLAMPGRVERVLFDEPTQMVHVLGRTPDGSGSTIYVIEPHGNAVFADARLPFSPQGWAIDAYGGNPSGDRQAILAASADGALASVDAGDHALAWRIPGMVAGAIMAGLIYLLVRTLFRRREVAVIAAILVLVDGMLFVQSRIAMNDVYVGLFIVAAYTLFAPLWLGRWRRPWAFWVVLPLIGLLLGLALASKWVGLYAIAAMAVLILGRSALGRILLILGLVAGTTVLGYMALAVSKDAVTSGGNYVFVGLMIALTLAAVLVAVLRPIAWSTEEIRLAIVGPAALGILLFLLAVPLGRASSEFVVGPVKITPIEASLGLILASGGVWLILRFAGAWGLGPFAATPAPDDPIRLTEPASPPPEGWLRPGALFGLPIVWAVVCFALIPVGVYVLSYLPWVALGNRLTNDWPPGNTGQTLLDLTKSMYDYHNGLRATHAASSPYWAWPFDLKPVWFYQDSFANGTSAAVYDAGNLVAWWISIPAIAFVAWQAFKRRSLALSLVFVAFAFQWMPWARIDRATFQYHYYAALPFLLIALAYFVAELRNGPSPRTWALARMAAGLAVLGPALMWLFKGPLCAFVRVDAVNPGSQACVATAPGQIILTWRSVGVAAALLLLGVLLVVQLLRLGRPGAGGPTDVLPDARASSRSRLVRIGATALAGVAFLALLAAVLPDTAFLSQDGFRIEPIALVVLVALAPVAWVVATARDPRRFAAGLILACVVFFVVWYPNIAALPLPSAIVNAYQGLLPTYLYAFQFPVNTDPVMQGLKLLDGPPIVLFGALLGTVIVVGYSAWTWRIAMAEREAEARDPGAIARGETG